MLINFLGINIILK